MNKLDPRRYEGIWLGIRDETGKAIVGTKEGVVKCRNFRRKPIEEDRWNVKAFDESRQDGYGNQDSNCPQ